MIRLVARITLSALAFMTVIPMIQGIDFHGNFVTALGLSVMFAVLLWAVELLALAIAALWTISSLGLALLWIIPLWILGFWILPAIAFMLVGTFMPGYLAVSGWLPACLAGLVMLAISLVTSHWSWRTARQD